MKPLGLGMLLAAVAFFTGGATLLRVYVDRSALGYLVLALALYTVGNILIAQVMRGFGLGATVAASTIATLICINLVSYFVFRDPLSPQQAAGVGLGVAAWVLIVFFPAR